MVILPITLTAAAAAALINIWLAVRISRVRVAEKIFMGDGGNDRLIGAMRAQSNFVEFTPFVLILIAAIELASGSTTLLWIAMALYMLARIAHGLGMDGTSNKLRPFGIWVTLIVTLALAIYAVVLPYTAPQRVSTEFIQRG